MLHLEYIYMFVRVYGEMDLSNDFCENSHQLASLT